ncbi:MAG: Transcriptional regulator [Conexibacter sp.]|nr:Transcriptional regulator [Conexibacter sp.]
MELRHLRYFVAVAEELSFTRAAERLHMAQPPLSTQIKQLEGLLGVELFDRSRRNIQLTEAGRALLVEARQLLVQLDQAIRVVQRVGSGQVGRLGVGFVPSASNSALPPLLRTFRARYPDVELYLREMQPDELLRGLHEGRLDVAFLYLPFDDETLASRPVSVEPLVVALGDDHPLAVRSQVAMEELAFEPFVLPGRYGMPGLHEKVLAACDEAGFTPRAVQKDVWLMQTIIGLVAAGIGVALVPASEQNIQRTGVAYRALAGSRPTVELGVAWRREHDTPVLVSFLSVVEELTRTAAEDAATEAPLSRGRTRRRVAAAQPRRRADR